MKVSPVFFELVHRVRTYSVVMDQCLTVAQLQAEWEDKLGPEERIVINVSEALHTFS